MPKKFPSSKIFNRQPATGQTCAQDWVASGALLLDVIVILISIFLISTSYILYGLQKTLSLYYSGTFFQNGAQASMKLLSHQSIDLMLPTCTAV